MTTDNPLVARFLRRSGWAATTKNRALWTYTNLDRWLDARGLKLVDATRDDLESYLVDLEEAGWAPASRQVEWRMLRALYRWLDDEKEIDHDPMAGTKFGKVPETPVQVLTVDEYRRLVDTCDRRTDLGRRDEAMLSLMFWSGLRRSEVVAVDLAALNLDAAQLTIGSRTFATKTRTVRRVPLAGETVAALDRYLTRREYDPGPLFLSQHGDSHDARRLRPQSITLMLKRRADAAQLGRTVGAHEFRRAMAIRHKRAGGSDVGLMAIAGWKGIAMIDRYTRMEREELAEEEFRRLVDTSQASTRRRGRRIR